MLDLCLCNPLSLLLIGVECNSFVPRFICITPQIISLSVSSCGASLLITVVWLMDLWILDLLLPHSSNILLSWFFPLSSLLFVADFHVNFPPFLLHSHFVD
jgi:hypothetical protein